MAGKVRVMIVEDNHQLAESISDYFGSKNEIEVTGIANNALEAIAQLETTVPDTIILDLVMPKADGFVLLQYLNTVHFDLNPQVIVLSALSNEVVLKRACDYGAVYFIVKPFSMSILYERIKELSGVHTMVPQKSQRIPSEISTDERIATILLTIGIPSHLKGYRYLLEGVRMLINKPEMINNMTKQLYPGIGEVFDTTAGNVERAIRTVIDFACKSGKIEKINALFGCDIYAKDNKITSSEILTLISNHILMQKN